MGVLKDTTYDRECVELDKEDSLFLYTDGVPETRNGEGELFGTEQLIDVLNRNSNGNPQKLKAAVLDSLSEFSGGRLEHDDVTMMALKIQ